MLSVTLLCTMDSESPSIFIFAVEQVVVSGFLDIELTIDVCFFFIVKDKMNFGFHFKC